MEPGVIIGEKCKDVLQSEADEIPGVQQLNLPCLLNGEQRQNSNTADMIFTVAEIIEYLYKHITLEPRKSYFNRYT